MTLNRNNNMETMKNKYMNPRFISGLLVTLSLTSLALFRLQSWASILLSAKGPMDLADMDSRIGGWVYYSWPELVQASLILTLACTALFALFSLRLSPGQKRSGDLTDRTATVSHRPATNLYVNPASAGMN
jgi:hypothetical protein